MGTYSVTKDAEIKKIKLLLKTGDQIAILAADNDSILIAKTEIKIIRISCLLIFDGVFRLQGKVSTLLSPQHSAILKQL